MIKTIYSVYHIPTKEFMPMQMFRTAQNGWSVWEPGTTDEELKPHNPNPRVFFTKKGAENSRDAWLKGKHRRVIKNSTGFVEDSEDYIEVTPMKDRKKEDILIVEGTVMWNLESILSTQQS